MVRIRRGTDKEEDQRTHGKRLESSLKYVDSRFQIQLEEDEGGSTGQSWTERSNQRPIFHLEKQGPKF